MTLVPDLLREQAEQNPDRIAVAVDGCGEMTYAQWEADSNRLARYLVERGLAAGDRVGILFPNSEGLSYLRSYHAVHKAGGVVVPLNTRSAVPELCRVLEHSGSSALIAGHEFADLAATISSALAGEALLLTAGDLDGAMSDGDVTGDSNQLVSDAPPEFTQVGKVG